MASRGAQLIHTKIAAQRPIGFELAAYRAASCRQAQWAISPCNADCIIKCPSAHPIRSLHLPAKQLTGIQNLLRSLPLRYGLDGDIYRQDANQLAKKLEQGLQSKRYAHLLKFRNNCQLIFFLPSNGRPVSQK